jgi:hypothetical protein
MTSVVPRGKLADDIMPAVPGAVVATVTETGASVPAVTVTDPGTVQVGAGVTAGVMLQLRLTVPLQLVELTARLNLALLPALTVALVWEPLAGPILNGSTAVPVKITVCDPPRALSVTTKFALAAPPAMGAKITLMLQLAFG